jgi:O-antigen/teichoic acid export membrane protein
VSVHRALFRRHRRKETVALAHRLAIVGIFFLACAVTSVTTLIFSVLLGGTAGLVFGGLCIALLLTLWLAIPWSVRLRSPDRPPESLPESGPGAAS